MENFADRLRQFPELAPGIIIGTIAGLIYGFVQDFRKDEFGNFWVSGGVGLVVGAIGWFLLIDLA